MRFSNLVDINPKVVLEKGKKYSCIMMDEMIPGRRYVPSSTKKEYTGGGTRFKTGDVLFARITPCLENGKIAQFRGEDNESAFGSTEYFIFRAKEKISDPAFVYYLTTTDTIRKPAEKSMFGVSGRQRADIDSIRDLEIQTPSLSIQRKIASILTAYDDLIENNTRRIKILEEMAQAIYREWFVEFRAPGVELRKATPEEQKLTGKGVFPKGWRIINYSDLVESTLGGDWGLEEPDEKELCAVKIIRGTDFNDILNGDNLRTPTRYISNQSLERRKLHTGDIVVENSVNAQSRCVGRSLHISDGILRRIGDDSICASFCKNIRLKNPDLAPIVYLHLKYLYAEGKMKFYQHIATNGIGNFQTTRFIDSEAIPVPADESVLKQMLDVLRNTVSTTFADQIYTLRHTRDLLLPKLISGEVDVEGIDINVSE